MRELLRDLRVFAQEVDHSIQRAEVGHRRLDVAAPRDIVEADR